MSPGLQVEDLTVDLGRRRVLDAFDLSVAKGTTVSVTGPNGSGKSTLLRAIAGLIPLVGGRVSIDGQDVTRLPTHRRDIGFLFQNLALFPHLDVGANIAYGLRMHGIPRPQRPERVRAMLDLVRLDGYANRSVATLSGGERQRVALARALAPSPSLLLLDEPFSAVGVDLKETLVGDVRTVLDRSGVTVVHVTHEPAEPGWLGAATTVHLNTPGTPTPAMT